MRDPFPGNIIPRDRFDNPLYDFYTQRMPLPKLRPIPAARPGEQLRRLRNAEYGRLQLLYNRVDYQASDKHRFFVRWLKTSFLEGAQDYTYSTEPGLMNWDEKRPAYSRGC